MDDCLLDHSSYYSPDGPICEGCFNDLHEGDDF